MAKSVKEVAEMLAKEHRANDPETQKVFWADAPDEVRLVEVSGSVDDRGEALPFRFTRDEPDVPYESVIILLSPADWERYERNALSLPRGFEDLEPLEMNE